jgi:hypothetical protein
MDVLQSYIFHSEGLYVKEKSRELFCFVAYRLNCAFDLEAWPFE